MKTPSVHKSTQTLKRKKCEGGENLKKCQFSFLSSGCCEYSIKSNSKFFLRFDLFSSSNVRCLQNAVRNKTEHIFCSLINFDLINFNSQINQKTYYSSLESVF